MAFYSMRNIPSPHFHCPIAFQTTTKELRPTPGECKRSCLSVCCAVEQKKHSLLGVKIPARNGVIGSGTPTDFLSVPVFFFLFFFFFYPNRSVFVGLVKEKFKKRI